MMFNKRNSSKEKPKRVEDKFKLMMQDYIMKIEEILSKPKRDEDKFNLMIQDYRMEIEEILAKPEIIEAFVKYYSSLEIETLKNFEKHYQKARQHFLAQKEKTGVFTISKQDPIDISYISTTVRIIILSGFIPLEENTRKSIEELLPLLKQEYNYELLTDEELEQQKLENDKERIRIIVQWIMRRAWFESSEEYEELYNSTAKLHLINSEIESRNLQKENSSKVLKK